jgi:uncharacterized membrane protein
MVSESILVAASFEKPEQAEAAVRELGEMGLARGDVSLAYTDTAHVVKEGLLQGAVFGGLVGGLVGLLFPPVGIVVAAGPLLGVLASALSSAGTLAVAGAAVGTLASGLIELGMPKEMATRFGEHIHKGDALVVVHSTPEQADRVRQILEAHTPRASESARAGSTAAA